MLKSDLALHSRITHGNALGPYGMPRIELGLATFKASALFSVLFIAPVHHYHYLQTFLHGH